MAWYLVAPIRRLRQGFERLAAGDMSVRLAPGMGGRHDEIADLARDFDVMAAQLEQSIQARERLLHDVSHELRSPLSRLQLAIGLARQDRPASKLPWTGSNMKAAVSIGRPRAAQPGAGREQAFTGRGLFRSHCPIGERPCRCAVRGGRGRHRDRVRLGRPAGDDAPACAATPNSCAGRSTTSSATPFVFPPAVNRFA